MHDSSPPAVPPDGARTPVVVEHGITRLDRVPLAAAWTDGLRLTTEPLVALTAAGDRDEARAAITTVADSYLRTVRRTSPSDRTTAAACPAPHGLRSQS